uniref:Immulectin 23 n=1 Tax=Hepialus xiaojinensis TaxID=1589740 RepID=A0A219YXI8_9NEOP|nr:immulectin 23 [Hepialus xiaojinensis]
MFRFLPIVLYCLGINSAKVIIPFFRSDYAYEPSQESFYKMHLVTKSWTEARAVCEAEGTSLVMPESKSEIEYLVKLMDENFPKHMIAAHIGIHDIFAEGIYVTLAGHYVSTTGDYWSPDEPNNFNNKEDCVHIRRSGKYNDIDCSSIYPFICKKTLDSLTENPRCATSDLAYFPGDNTGSCYKLHLTPETWSDAFATCYAEQSYLAIINSADEAQLFKQKMADYPPDSLHGEFFKDGIYLGFHDMFSEGRHVTIQGTLLSQTGFAQWSPGQPDNNSENENCGHMYRSGLLNDINCSCKLIFFCERDIENSERNNISIKNLVTSN